MNDREEIKNCFKRNLMQTEGDTELFDTELTIDEIAKLITQSNRDLLERVKKEVIGVDKVNHNHVWHLTGGCGCTYFTKEDRANNDLRASQRSALQKTEESL